MPIHDGSHACVLLATAGCAASLLVAAGCTTAPPARPASATACYSATPPPDAGEVEDSGTRMLVHPRAINMGPGYTGCQSVWMDIGGSTRLIGRFWYDQGRYVAYSAPVDGRPEATLCRYRDGRLTEGDPHDCESDVAQPIASMAPGCWQAVRQGEIFKRPVPARCLVHE